MYEITMLSRTDTVTEAIKINRANKTVSNDVGIRLGELECKKEIIPEAERRRKVGPMRVIQTT